MLRVAMVTEYPEDGSRVDGGVQAVAKYLINALTGFDDVDIHVVTFKYGISIAETFDADGFTRHVIPAARLGAFSLYSKDQQVLNTCLDSIQPDIVHSQGAGHYGIVATRSRFPTVMTIHGIMSEEAKYVTNLRTRFRRVLISSLSDRIAIPRAKHTILISPYVADYYGSRLGGRHYQIPNPISSDFFDIVAAHERGRILFAGRLLPLKGIMDLLHATAAVAKTQEVRLTLAGSLENHSYVKKLKSEANRLGIREIVQFPGILDEKSLRMEFGRSAMLVLPSYQETAPMVIQEAMAVGLPVIASGIGGIPYQVVDGVTGFLINPGDVDSLADHLLALLSDESMRAAFGFAAQQHAAREYRAENVAHKTIEVYRQIISH